MCHIAFCRQEYLFYASLFSAGFVPHKCYNKSNKSNPQNEAINLTIYADVLFCVNFIIDYFLLQLTAKISKSPCKFARQLAAAAFGAACSFIILLPSAGAFLICVFRLVTAAATVVIAFGFFSKQCFLKRTICFYLSSLLFSGTVFLLWSTLKPNGMFFKNGIMYYKLSAPILIGVSAAVYAIITVALRFFKRNSAVVCRVTVKDGGVCEQITALVDSGNLLKEPFSQKPVMLLDKRYEDIFCGNGKPHRVIPYSTVSGSGVISGFQPDSVTYEAGGVSTPIDVYLAVSKTPLEKEYGAVIGTDAF